MTDQNFEADVIDLAGDYYEQQLEAIEAANLENATVLYVEVEFYKGSNEVISYRLHRKLNEARGVEMYYILATYPVTGDTNDFFAYDNLESAIRLFGMLVGGQKVVSFRAVGRY